MSRDDISLSRDSSFTWSGPLCAVLVVTRLAAFWWRTDINFPNPEFFFPTGSLALARFMSKPARRLVMRWELSGVILMWVSLPYCARLLIKE